MYKYKKSGFLNLILKTKNKAPYVPILTDKKQPYKNKQSQQIFSNSVRLLISILILFGSILMICTFISTENTKSENRENLIYNNLIWPIVMQDPSSFNEENPPSNKLILDSSVWYSAINKKSDSSSFNEEYSLVLNEEEVKNSVKTLFGSKIASRDIRSESSYFYDFDDINKNFTVRLEDSYEKFCPHIISSTQQNDCIILRVGYMLSTSKFNDKNSSKSNLKFEKTAKYILKKDFSTQNFYISSLEVYSH